MGCCDDCYDEESSELNDKSKIKRRKIIKTIYFSLLFLYCLIQMILAFQANQSFQFLPKSYSNFISNWKQDPIIEIDLPNSDGICSNDQQEMFIITTPNENKVYNKWAIETQSFALCIKRLEGYNFAEKYPTQPKCDSENEQVCGGTSVENKFCIPKQEICPLNSILFVNKEQQQQLSRDKYPYQLAINSDYYIASSNLDENLPISELRITNGVFACSSYNSDYSILFQGSDCGGNDTRYTQLSKISKSQYATANSLQTQSIVVNDIRVGFYSRNYITWTLECRDKNLAKRALRAEWSYDRISQLQLTLMFVSSINFGIVGCVFILIGILDMISEPQSKTRFCISSFMFYFKLFIQIVHWVVLLAAFGFTIDQKIFVDRVIKLKCSDDVTQKMFEEINKEVINDVYIYDLAIFFIFLGYFFLEIIACYVYLEISMKKKKKPKKYNQLNVSQSSQQKYSYIFNPGFQSQIIQPVQVNQQQVEVPQKVQLQPQQEYNSGQQFAQFQSFNGSTSQQYPSNPKSNYNQQPMPPVDEADQLPKYQPKYQDR